MSELRLEIEELEQRIAPVQAFTFLLGVTPPGNTDYAGLKPGAEVCLPDNANPGINNAAAAGGVVFDGGPCDHGDDV
jgi:hypothetical protein